MRVMLFLVLAAVPAAAQPDKKTDAIDRAVLALIKDKVIAGAVTIVAQDGKLLHVSAHGEASPGNPMTRDAVFRIYSMTKPITSVAALLLVEEGKLALDAPVSKYLPAFANLKVLGGAAPKRAMTVRDLFRHTSGITYGRRPKKLAQLYSQARLRRAKDLAGMIERLSKLPLASDPGTAWHYSFSTDVLGAVIEVVSKKTLAEFFRERIFKPLKMTDTGFFVREDQRARFTANYGRKLVVIDSPKTSRFLQKPTRFSGGGGLVSTADDYLKFCRMLRADGTPVLKKATVAEMTRNQLPKELLPIRLGGARRPGTGFGLGVSVRFAKTPPETFGEFGWGGAASTRFTIAPARKLIVITMTQRMPQATRLYEAVRPLAFEMTSAASK